MKTEPRPLPKMVYDTATAEPWRSRLLAVLAVFLLIGIMVNLLVIIDQHITRLTVVRESYSGTVPLWRHLLEGIVQLLALVLTIGMSRFGSMDE